MIAVRAYCSTSRGSFKAPLHRRTRATRSCRHARNRRTETAGSRGVCGRARAVAWRASCAPRNDDRSASSLAGHPCSDHRRSRVPARNREIRTPRVGRSHFGGGGSGSRSAVPTYPQPPHKWTTSPDSGRTGGSLRASRIASPHWGQIGAVSGSFRTSIELGEHDGRCISRRAVSARAARQPNTAAPVTEKLVFGPVLLASHGPNEGGTAPLCRLQDGAGGDCLEARVTGLAGRRTG